LDGAGLVLVGPGGILPPMNWLCAAVVALPLVAQSPLDRPPLLGIAHLAVFVSSPDAARAFYQDLLGFEESFAVPATQSSPARAFVKINDRQWIELISAPTAGEGQLDHVAVYTADAGRMRQYLAGRGVRVPDAVAIGPTGDRTFAVTDPDGHRIEFVEYRADSRTGQDAGAHVPRTRISDHALHVGILVGDLAKATSFYGGILGFEEIWRGSAANSPTLSWVNMRVPDGTDYLEFMLYGEKPAPDRRGTAHHLCLSVPDAMKAAAELESRPARKAYARSIEVRTGINRKRQVNLFDPDGTRVELMEPDTVDGKPTPSSTLPPPR
jgi:catechol 2,3-dioxygenase-like lactoylglutathione lyase family enzyme